MEHGPRFETAGRYQRVVLELAALDKWDYAESLQRILRLDAETLEIERVNFWLLDDDPPAIRMEAGYIRSGGRQEPGVSLTAADYPRYFAALRQEEVIDAADARRDARTSEFADEYLPALGIGAMMDIPIWSKGRLAGVLCHEHVGPPRTWTKREQELALAMAQAIANTLEVRERRRAEEALHRAEQDKAVLSAREQVAREQVEARDEFMSVASHELYTPLTSLQLAVDLLRTQIDGAPAEKQLLLVERQVRRLTELVSNLLDVSRIQASRLVMSREDFDLAALCRDVSERFLPVFSRCGTPLTLDTPEPVVGHWDRSHLDQVISNLLSNAAKFSIGSPVEVSVSKDGSRARLAVRDQGIGIAAERLPRIAERFERAVSTRSYGGLGLGLFIVRGIVEAHGGQMNVTSTLGKGTTVTVELPIEGEPR
jgi:signal transduction histidine kinase